MRFFDLIAECLRVARWAVACLLDKEARCERCRRQRRHWEGFIRTYAGTICGRCLHAERGT